MSNIQYNEEQIKDIRNELEPLIIEHWKEIAIHQDKIKLNPDWEKYELISDLGILRCFTARENGRLIGYFIVFAQPHLHYVDHVFASNDVIYIDKKYRSTGVGANMILHVEKELKQSGVSVLVVNMKCHAPFDPLMEGLGFTNIERVYSKFIGD